MVRTRALTKRYGSVRAVDAVDLDVREGDVFGFLGANGSGKTTTVRMLLGLVLPTSGEAEVLGEPMPARRSSVLSRLGALVEGPGAYGHLSGRANLDLLDATGPDRLARSARRIRVDEVLEQVGLDPGDRRPVRTYSLGMRQRLGLAAALFRRPRLLILDEPTNGLDPQGIAEIRELLLQLNRAGTTVFLSSHLLAEIEQMCNRVAVLDRGRLVLQQDLSELLRPSPYVEVRTTEPARCVELLGSAAERIDHDRVLVETPDSAGLNARLIGQGVDVVEISRRRPNLEDVVLAASRSWS